MDKLSSEKINKLVLSAYDSIAYSYTKAYAENDEYDVKYLEEFISRLEGKVILDMGCGTGTNAIYLKRKDLLVAGVDGSKKMLDIARKIYPSITFKKQNILKTSFKKEKFDGIVIAYVINHFNQEGLEQLKIEIDRILKKNGIIFISAHMGEKEKFLPDPLDASIKIYYNFFTVDVLDALFRNYKKEYYSTRQSFGEEEILCDKMFVVYRRQD